MPIYAYQCVECGFSKDFLQKISDPVFFVCPSCNKPEFKKQVTAAAFQLKGSGWYATDFKGADLKAADSSSDVSETSKNASGESKTTTADSTTSAGSAADLPKTPGAATKPDSTTTSPSVN